jgi:hypothetical protein
MSGPPDFRLEHSKSRAADEFGEFASEDLPYYADWHGSFEKLPWALDEEALRGADVISALAVQRGMMRDPRSLARGLDGLTGAGRLGEADREAH